ncbi:cytochrome protein [Massarina eburnea CBS 473.64]|uniref:Cytochrome protein n=1 Tax=Massarina eburnea CBS 473.64 TaxID=1395130 RepID=A0A6A6RPR3_9PLEO|nr:cytochrome protein [Massarina eburnea CBS 473.64]
MSPLIVNGVTGILVLSLVKILWTLIQCTRSPVAVVPGPWHTKYTSVVATYKLLTGTRTEWVEELHQRYGNIVRLSPNEIQFSSIKAVKTIHSYRKVFPKSAFYSYFTSAYKVQSVFNTTDLVTHARYRRLLAGPLSESGLKNVEALVDSRATMAIEKIGEEMDKKGYANAMQWWLFMATDVIGELSFGDSFRMLELGHKTQYALDLQSVAPAIGIISAFPTFYYATKRLGLPFFRNTMSRVARMRSYAEQSIQRYDRVIATNPQNAKPTLLTKLFLAQEKDETMSQEEITANAQAFIVAGSDTTAHTMTYITWMLCRPENIGIKKTLLAELATLPEVFHNEDLKNLQYLDGVIHEALRLFAPAPAGLPRDVPKGGCEVDGVWLPEGTVVTTQAYTLHRDPAVFPEPEKLKPERWANPTQNMKDAFMPWGGGSRICIGMHLAYMEMRLATAKFFRRFPDSRTSTAEGFCDSDMDQVIFFLMFPKKKRCMIEAK